MPNKTAKTAAKATGSKATVSKVAAKTAPKTVVKPVAHKPAAAKPAVAAPRVDEPKKVLTQRQGFKTNEFVVYPAHGVGQILAIEEQEIAGAKLELFVINFMKDKMTLRVPTAKVANVGMRKLSEPALVKRALETLKGRARVKRTMWSRRAQEYEAKINSGDIVAIAEVVRDLYRSESQPEQSYSERQLYEAALDRLSREIAVVQHVTETEAVKEIESQLAKSPRRGAKAEAEVEADGEADADDGDDAAVADEAA
jgi:CarD family transcriptional regulator